MLPDLSKLDDEKRLRAADRVQQLKDFQLPELKWLNSEPCPKHESITEDESCQNCGIKLRKHQRVGVAWLYFRKMGLIADQVGTGKTVQVVGLLAAIKETGELSDGFAVIAVRPGAIHQWAQQLERSIPDIRVEIATGTRPQRIEKYLRPWEVLLIGWQMLVQDREILANFTIKTLVMDDVDALRHKGNRASHALKWIAEDCNRVVILNGTPMQKRLLELFSVLEPIGGRRIFGSQTAFRERYLREENVRVWNPKLHRSIVKKELVGYKNLDEFKQKIAPLVLRRTADDIDDVDLPDVIAHNVFVELHPKQRAKYEELRKDVLSIMKDGKTTIKMAQAGVKFTYGAQICSGLASIGEDDGPGASSKLDWVQQQVTEGGDLSEEKTVVFINYKSAIRAFHQRMEAAGVPFVTIWGDEPSKKARWAAQQRFWEDPDCKLLIGTTSIEQSLNLQVARHLVNVDTLMNAKRMEQLMGRIRRAGSAHRSIYVHSLLALGTQEERYLAVLRKEAALSDHLFGDRAELFESLSPQELMQLIGERYEG